MCCPLSGGAFQRRLSVVLVRPISLGALGWSGSQHWVVNETVSLAPPEKENKIKIINFFTYSCWHYTEIHSTSVHGYFFIISLPND